MEWDKDHIVQVAGETYYPDAPDADVPSWRKRVEPWLSAVFQAEHLSLLLGNGFTTAMAYQAGGKPISMDAADFSCPHADKVRTFATKAAREMGRGAPNIEDNLSAALALQKGLTILEAAEAVTWDAAINKVMAGFIADVLKTEHEIQAGLEKAPTPGVLSPRETLISFLMSFASRAASRERLHAFTTNYDRLIERGCDYAGLRVLDRFVGAVQPEFRSSRLQVDLHYMPPGSRSEPRRLEGVVYVTKLHGSLDWRYESPRLFREPLPFGADKAHPGVPAEPAATVMIYPNSVKDVETAAYPYADLFRDFSAALCRPNSVLVTYGYGFGDDHVNRIISDMLTIPSTHLVVIARSTRPHDRLASFLDRAGHADQTSLLIGSHFGDLSKLVASYLPKPAIDPHTMRMADLMERRRKIGDPPTGAGA